MRRISGFDTTDNLKVIQVSDVPSKVHDTLAYAAKANGMPLSRYILRELEQLAKRVQMVESPAAIVRETRTEVCDHVDPDSLVAALREGRYDWWNA